MRNLMIYNRFMHNYIVVRNKNKKNYNEDCVAVV